MAESLVTNPDIPPPCKHSRAQPAQVCHTILYYQFTPWSLQDIILPLDLSGLLGTPTGRTGAESDAGCNLVWKFHKF